MIFWTQTSNSINFALTFESQETPKSNDKCGTKKKCADSPTGFEPMTSQTPGTHSIRLSYRELMESKAT